MELRSITHFLANNKNSILAVSDGLSGVALLVSAAVGTFFLFGWFMGVPPLGVGNIILSAAGFGSTAIFAATTFTLSFLTYISKKRTKAAERRQQLEDERLDNEKNRIETNFISHCCSFQSFSEHLLQEYNQNDIASLLVIINYLSYVIDKKYPEGDYCGLDLEFSTFLDREEIQEELKKNNLFTNLTSFGFDLMGYQGETAPDRLCESTRESLKALTQQLKEFSEFVQRDQ